MYPREIFESTKSVKFNLRKVRNNVNAIIMSREGFTTRNEFVMRNDLTTYHLAIVLLRNDLTTSKLFYYYAMILLPCNYLAIRNDLTST